MNLKEFLSRYEFFVEGRHYMGKQAQENLENKYIHSDAIRQGYSKEDFYKIRSKQIGNLYDAYTQIARGRGHLMLMRPNSITDTSEEALRRVTGANMTYNSGLITLDYNDRAIISAIVIEYNNKRVYDSLSRYSVENILNNIEALHALSEKALGKNVSIHDMIRETDVLKTELSMESTSYRTETFEQYAQYNPPSNTLLSKIVKSIKKSLDPEKAKTEADRLDNTEIPRIRII